MRTLLPFLALLPLPGCLDEGYRAEHGCPAGEVCSDTTPDGLLFGGASFGDESLFGDPGVKVTAVGGTQRIDVYDNATGTALRARYDATVSDDALEILAAGGASVEVAGRAPGGASLELRDDGGLLDRIWLTSAAIDEIALVVPPHEGYRSDGTRPAVLWQGASIDLVVQLATAGGTRLVDETLRIDGAAPSRWDTAAIDAVPAGGVTLTVEAGDRPPVTLAMPATAAIDAVTGALIGDEARAGGSAIVCFEAEDDGADVLGAPWELAATGPATLEGAWPFAPNCAVLALTAEGTVTVTGAAPGASATVTIDVLPPARRAAATAPASPGLTPGERAR